MHVIETKMYNISNNSHCSNCNVTYLYPYDNVLLNTSYSDTKWLNNHPIYLVSSPFFKRILTLFSILNFIK